MNAALEDEVVIAGKRIGTVIQQDEGRIRRNIRISMRAQHHRG
jgi:hypothetical protein